MLAALPCLGGGFGRAIGADLLREWTGTDRDVGSGSMGEIALLGKDDDVGFVELRGVASAGTETAFTNGVVPLCGFLFG